MKKFNFKKIDAFATNNSEGNPAGYVLLESTSEISEAEMLQIAYELRNFVNEVGYVAQTDSNSFDLRYYSAEKEVDFCGHATIAIMYDIFNNNEEISHLENLNIKTNRGVLKVENKTKQEDAVFILSPEPIENPVVPPINNICENLKIATEEINSALPVSIINAGLNTLLVPIESLESILSINPDINQLKEFCNKNKIDIIEVFTSKTSNKKSNYRTRVFAATFGYLEDPATGSGNSALGYYLQKNNLWNSKTITIEQNASREKFNIIKLQKQKDEKGNNRVLFGGGAICRLEGEYLLL